MSTPENATKTTVEQINHEINAIDQRIKKVKRQIKLLRTEEDIRWWISLTSPTLRSSILQYPD